MPNNISSKNCGFQWVNSDTYKKISMSIEVGNNRDHIGSWVSRIFDQIADWYCGTQRAEVKKHLYDLISPDSSAKKKFSAFYMLRDMVSEGHQDKFSQEISCEKDEMNVVYLLIKIEGEPILIDVKINAEADLMLKKYLHKNASMDLDKFKPLRFEKINFKSIKFEGKCLKIKNLYDLNSHAISHGYLWSNISFYERILTRENWSILCRNLNLPTILTKIHPKFIDIEMWKSLNKNLILILSVDAKKYNEASVDASLLHEIHGEVTKHLREAAIKDSYMPEVQNDEKIHSANFSIALIARGSRYFKAEVRGTISEYIGPDISYFDHSAIYKIEHGDVINEIRRSAFFLEECPGIDLNPIKKRQAMQVDASNEDAKIIYYVFNAWIIDVRKELAEIEEHNVQEQLKPKPHNLRDFRINFFKPKELTASNARWLGALDKFKICDFEYVELFTQSINKLVFDYNLHGNNDLNKAVENMKYGLYLEAIGRFNFKIRSLDNYRGNFSFNDGIVRMMAVALNNGYLSIVSTLIHLFPKGVNGELEQGVTFLMSAIKWGDDKLVRKLIENGADIKAVDENGRSAMFYAIQYNSIDLIKYILYDVNKASDKLPEKLKLGDFSGLDSDNNNAMDICCRYLNLYSSEKPASISWIFDSSEPDGLNIEKSGLEKLYMDLVEKMLDLGWGVHSKDSFGLMPVNYIQASGNRKLANRLLAMDNLSFVAAQAVADKESKEKFQIVPAVIDEDGSK